MFSFASKRMPLNCLIMTMMLMMILMCLLYSKNRGGEGSRGSDTVTCLCAIAISGGRTINLPILILPNRQDAFDSPLTSDSFSPPFSSMMFPTFTSKSIKEASIKEAMLCHMVNNALFHTRGGWWGKLMALIENQVFIDYLHTDGVRRGILQTSSTVLY